MQTDPGQGSCGLLGKWDLTQAEDCGKQGVPCPTESEGHSLHGHQEGRRHKNRRGRSNNGVTARVT